MFRNYILIAWRNLIKSKVFSLINILGLTIGITVCMMIFLYIMNEFSYDEFHTKKDRIFRVMRYTSKSGMFAPYLSGPYAPALLNDFQGEIISAVRVLPANGLVSFGDKAFNEKRLHIVDTNFFSVFSFPLVKGNPATALEDPNSIVLSEKTSKKYFGEEDPIGKLIRLDNEYVLKVTGIFKDLPINSHLYFDLVMPITLFTTAEWFNVWINNNNFTYVLLDKNASEEKLESRFPAFMQKYLGKEMQSMGVTLNLALTPLTDIYFEPSSAFDNVKHGDRRVVFIFLTIAAFILLIASINFVNLSTIRAADRSKEVGLRKVMGARRKQLLLQFMGESVMITLISCLLAVLLLSLLMPFYNDLLGYKLTVSWKSPLVWSFLIGVVLVAGLLAGSYPAFFLAAFLPVQALRGKIIPGKSGAIFRQALVVLQFTISVMLIIGTVIIMNQMKYVRKKDLGYNKEQIVIIRIDNSEINDHAVSFKRELENRPEIESVSLMSGEPGGFFDMFAFEAEGQNETWKARTEFSDFEIVETLQLKIIAGRDFSPDFRTDSAKSAIINRTAANSLGFTPEDALGKWIRNTVRDTIKRTIVGVVEDFNFLSLKEKMDALVIAPNIDRRVVLIKIKGGSINKGLEAISELYRSFAPGYPFEYSFQDQQFGEMYKTDLKQQKILSIFSALAIFIACLGLFGLASFTATKRSKEISIRKVLGSSVKSIVLMLSKDLLKPVLIAAIIAIPAGYVIMDHWLQNFAYRTVLQWWIFLFAAAVTMVVALVTVCAKAIKAAKTKPVTYLKSE
ncbi:MAG TPA: ABC transporter permease [Lentimicrobium sp.]|nr:ABC transporter permease [Lentimicrobium sp.]